MTEAESIDINNITLDDSERQPCEVWTRVMGYHRPTSSYNAGKQAEFADRKYFAEPHVNKMPAA